METNKRPLDGIRVIDFSQVWAGPYATLLLALMGAEVIKVESRKRIDGSRLSSLTTGQRFSGFDSSTVYNELNLNKMDICLDLGQPKAIELAKRLVTISDVALQNFRPGVMDRLGLGYEALSEVKPNIIYLSSSACGSTGPERAYAGYAPGFASLSGLASLTGYSDGPPFTMGGRIDLISATTSAFAIVAALNYRARTGEGQYIDLSSSESISVTIGDVLMDYTMNRRSRRRDGNHDEVMAPHNCYRCKGEDDWISIAISNDEEWRAFVNAIGNLDWARDEKFQDAFSRKQNEDELDRLISQWTINHTKYEVMDMLQKAGVAAVPSFSSEDLFNDPHLKERGFATELEHPIMGKTTVLSPPWKLSATPARITRHAPLFGEHNNYVFGELLGMSQEEIETLMEEEVIH